MPARKKFLETFKKILLVFKKVFTLNIGTVLFGALFLYMIVTVILYVTSTHVTSYQVTSGPLTKNPICTALAVRSEEVITADSTGHIEYYAREGMRVRKNGAVFAIGNSKNTDAAITLDPDELEKLRVQMKKFSSNFDANDFYNTYNFKYELQGSIIQSYGLNKNTSSNDSDEVYVHSSMTFGNQTVHTAPKSGIVVYSRDGYESKEADKLTSDDFNQKAYKINNLLKTDAVEIGEPVYKLITDERWTLVVPVTDKQAALLADRRFLKVKFLKDGLTQTGSISIAEKDGHKYAHIDLMNGMVRYASDRFLNVELVVNTQSGLKIPMSSIVTKEFYIIPEDFIAKGDNGDDAGFIREVKNNGKTTAEFFAATIYEKKNGYYFVDKSEFSKGDIIKKQGKKDTFTVGEIEFLEGVYNMNKGYAVFRKIEILAQNEEFCIISRNTSYGLEEFDHIVLNGESVKEEDILY